MSKITWSAKANGMKSAEKLLNKDEIYTFIGRYSGITFTDDNGNEYRFLTYRIVNEQIDNSKLCIVNVRYIAEHCNAWVIFQYVLLEE